MIVFIEVECNTMTANPAGPYQTVTQVKEGKQQGMCIDSKSQFDMRAMDKCGMDIGIRKGHTK